MSTVIDTAVDAINTKLGSDGFDGSIKIDIEDEGTFIINENGASASDEEMDCTMSSDAETFQGIMDGDVNATGAFMAGKLKVDGDMSQAMKLAAVLG